MNIGSYETLLTLPVSFTDIAIGKFIASVAFTVCMLLPTISYAFCISMVGDLDPGPVIGGYIGAVLLGGAYCAIGIFASCLTRNQIVAFIIGSFFCFTFTIISKLLLFVPAPLTGIVGFLGADSHFQNIAKGVIDSRDIIYFLSLMFLGLFGTYLVMQERN